MPANKIPIIDYANEDGIHINPTQLLYFGSTRPYCHYCQTFPYNDGCIVTMSDCVGVVDSWYDTYISVFMLTFALTPSASSANFEMNF